MALQILKRDWHPFRPGIVKNRARRLQISFVFIPGTEVEIPANVANVSGLVVFSALPFIAVQSFADSQLGRDFRNRLEADKLRLKEESLQRERERVDARRTIKWYGPDRPKWLDPFRTPVPLHLNGTLPGDYGYDPLSLGKDPSKLKRYVSIELLHARWAMLGLLGAVVPELLQRADIAQFAEDKWWNVGYAKLQGEDLNYLGIAGLRIAGASGIGIIALCQVLLMFGPEYARSCGIEALEPLGIYLPGSEDYPGGWLFDPLGLSSNPVQFELNKVREIKNGRLSMVAWLGFAAQAAVTKTGPVDNLIAWIGF